MFDDPLQSCLKLFPSPKFSFKLVFCEFQLLLTPKDLSFVGYTYKNFDAVKGLRRAFGMHSCFLVHVSCLL